MAYIGKKSKKKKEWKYAYIYLAESLRCTAETNTTLLINCTSIKRTN